MTGSIDARVAEVRVAADPAAWRACGFLLDDDGVGRLGAVRVRVDPALGKPGLRSWAVTAAAAMSSGTVAIDGLPTDLAEPSPPRASATGAAAAVGLDGPDGPAGVGSARGPLGVVGIDHLVVLTPDLARTVSAVENGLGLPLLRTHDSDTYGAPMRQAFFRMGEVILEVVGGQEPDPRGGPARFYGLALTVADLDAAADRLGGLLGRVKPAVQPGRFIATVRQDAALGAAVALMSPEPDRG